MKELALQPKERHYNHRPYTTWRSPTGAETAFGNDTIQRANAGLGSD